MRKLLLTPLFVDSIRVFKIDSSTSNTKNKIIITKKKKENNAWLVVEEMLHDCDFMGLNMC